MHLLKKVFEWTVDLLTAVMAVYVVWIVGQRFLSPNGFSPGSLHEGSRVSLSEVNWPGNRLTLIMALSIGCHYCEASANFYRALLHAAPPGTFHPIAVFPQPIKDAKAYLNSLGINVADVRQRDLGSLGVAGTPTLILVNEKGRVKSTWVGQLPPPREEEVFRLLGISDAARSSSYKNSRGTLPPSVISASQFRELVIQMPSTPVIDVRLSSDYGKGHLTDSVSIPFDELEVRAVHEIPARVPIVVYCHYYAPCEGQKSDEGVPTFCTMAAHMLERAGYTNLRLVSGNLADLEQLGFSITGTTDEGTILQPNPQIR